MQSKIASVMIAAIFVLTTGVLPDDTFAQSNKKGSSSAIASKSSKGRRGKAKSTRQNKAKSSQGGGKSRGQSAKKGNSNGSDSARGSLGSSNGFGNVALTSQVPATNTTQYAATPIPSTVETTTAIDAERDPADSQKVEIDYYGNLVPRTGRLDHEDRPECLLEYDLCLIEKILDPQRGHLTEVQYQELVTKLENKRSKYNKLMLELENKRPEYNELMLEIGRFSSYASKPPNPEWYDSPQRMADYVEYVKDMLGLINGLEIATAVLREEIAAHEQELAPLREEIAAHEQELALILNDLHMAFSKEECLGVYRWCEYEMDHPSQPKRKLAA